jgi:hypothetical protein
MTSRIFQPVAWYNLADVSEVLTETSHKLYLIIRRNIPQHILVIFGFLFRKMKLFQDCVGGTMDAPREVAIRA